MNKDISKTNKAKYDNFYSIIDKPLKIYEIYFRTMMVKEMVERYSDISNKKVMDIGFGTGEMLKIFDKDCEIYGIDISKYSKSIFLKNSKKFKKLNVTIKDLNTSSKLSKRNNFFDIVILSHVLEHLHKYKIVLKESYKILKRGGIAIILIPINENKKDSSHLFCLNKNNLTKYLKEVGFDVITSIENFSLIKLPPVIYQEKSLVNTFKSNISKSLNNIMIKLGYNTLKQADNIFHSIGFKPNQAIIVVRK